MNRTQISNRLTIALLVAAVGASATTLPAASAATEENATADLETLAALLNAQPRATDLVGSAGEKANCGTPGECNYTECPDPGCKRDESKSCTCSASGGKCGFFTKYPVYDCTCECYKSDTKDDEKCTEIAAGIKFCDDDLPVTEVTKSSNASV